MTKGSLRVLIVEDDPASRTGLAAALEDAGMEVTTAESAEQAIDQLNGSSPNVLLSDIMMAEKSGIDLLRFVREHYPDVAVILVTAFPTEQLRRTAAEEGAAGFFAKPLKLDVLEAAVRAAAGEP